MAMIKWFTIVPIVIAWFNLNSQNNKPLQQEMVDLSDELLDEFVGEGSDDVDIIDQLKIVNLNKCTAQDLIQFPWLSPLQIQSLIHYRTIYGPIVSIYELQAIPGWNLEATRLTEPWVYIDDRISQNDPRTIREQLTYDGGLELMMRSKRRIQTSLGYLREDRSAYQGSPWYWLFSLRYRKKGKINLGLRAEKDSGERFHWDPENGTYGPDHLSMFLILENLGKVKKLILGDFRVQWDQGLAMGSGFIFRKLVITGPRKVHQGFLPHSSTQEFGFFRGVGMELALGKVVFSSIYSYRMLDANLRPLGSSDRMFAPSIITTGLHRTITEIERKNQVSEQIIGFHLSKPYLNRLVFSFSGIHRSVKYPIFPLKSWHNRYHFAGSYNLNITSGVQYDWKNFNITGQLAVSKSRGMAAVLIVMASLAPNVSMTMHLRNYDKNFHSVAGKAFGASSNNINEQGVYWGLQVSPSKKFTLGYYNDLFRHPKPTFRSDAASNGMDQLLRIQFIPTKMALVDFYWRGLTRQVNGEPSNFKLTNEIKPWTKHTLGLRGKWQHDNRLTWAGRYQFSIVTKGGQSTSGMIISNQLTFDLDFIRLTGNVAFFDTDDFDNRQYIFEKDLPNNYSIPFFEGYGTRWYLMAQLKILRNVDMWMRIAHSNYKDRDQVGSGNEVVTGSNRTDLSVQIRYKL